MKKVFLLSLLFICFVFGIILFNISKSYAANSLLDLMAKQLNDLMPFWTNMYNCNKYEKTILSYTGEYSYYYKILGVENNSCHNLLLITVISH